LKYGSRGTVRTFLFMTQGNARANLTERISIRSMDKSRAAHSGKARSADSPVIAIGTRERAELDAKMQLHDGRFVNPSPDDACCDAPVEWWFVQARVAGERAGAREFMMAFCAVPTACGIAAGVHRL